MNMITARRRSAALLFGLALCAVVPASAQESDYDPDSYAYDTAYAPAPSPERSAVMKEFETKFIWKTLDYWTGQLNRYKTRIDRTVSECDLAELNRLRVYWTMFLDEKRWKGMIDGVDDIMGSDLGGSSYGQTEVMTAPAVPYEEYDSNYDYTVADTAVMMYDADSYASDTAILIPADGFTPESAEATIEVETSIDAGQAEDLVAVPPVMGESYDGSEYNYGSGETTTEWQPPTPEEVEAELTETLAFVDKVSEMAETFFVAKWIARRYRPEFDKIREDMAADTRNFIDTMMIFKERFEVEHAAAIAADPEMMRVMEEFTREHADEAMLHLGSEKSVMMMYNIVIEPLLLLYNGQDLRGLLKEVDALPEEITELPLPEMSALRQNVPNPASTATTITFVLDEPSNRTAIRLYDSRGELMTWKDLGYQSAGEHQVEIDISKFPAGSYLYHLTVQGTRGERVYSKTMQVVR